MASFVRVGEHLPVAPAPAPWRQEDWAERVETAVNNGAEYLLSVQSEEGYWLGELEADTTLESDYIYYLHVLGQGGARAHRQTRELCSPQTAGHGGWPIYPGGPSELNATTKAYFALKLAGDSPDAPHMVTARETIQRLGGLEHTNSYVRFYLALVGAVGWEIVPAIPAGADAPAELVLLQHL